VGRCAWNPDRTLAVLSISGQWPYYKDVITNKDGSPSINSSPDWGDKTIDGVPGLTAGVAQTLTFPTIPDQTEGAAPTKLAATSSANAPISYYVREGPAEVGQDGPLTLTPIPPRSKYPIEVTVIATQWAVLLSQSYKPRK